MAVYVCTARPSGRAVLRSGAGNLPFARKVHSALPARGRACAGLTCIHFRRRRPSRFRHSVQAMAHGQHPPAQAPSSPLAGEWLNVELALRKPDLWQGGSLNSGALARVMRVLERVLRMVGEGVRGPAGARYKLLADQSLRRSRGQRGVPLACCPPHRARERQGQQGEGRGVHGRAVAERKACRLCAPALTNPAAVEAGRYDSDEVGPWSRWQGHLGARLMVVGQDWGDTRYFTRYAEREASRNPTNITLAKLLAVHVQTESTAHGADKERSRVQEHPDSN